MNRIALAGLFFSLVLASVTAWGYEPRSGDIVFQRADTPQGRAIELATHSRYTHMGMVVIRHGRPQVLEAYAKVAFTPLREWMKRGKDEFFVAKRLRNPAVITEQAAQEFHVLALRFLGREYDYFFEWTDARFYCSELVWKLYDRVLNLRLGKLQSMEDFDLTHPFVRAMLRQRFGENPPLWEPVIAPDAMFQDLALETVFQQGP